MDPNETLSLMLARAADIQEGLDPADGMTLEEVAADLAELTFTLDTWLRNGGFLPATWMEHRA